MNRVARAVAKANERLSVGWAASLLAGSTLLSSLLGLFRDRLLNSTYYSGEVSYPIGIDAYTVAFIIPDFMFFILVSGALSVTFIPVFNDRLAKNNKKSAWELSTSLINLMAIVTLIASVLIIIFAEPLVRYVVAPGFGEQGTGLAVSMMRVIAVNPFLFAIATVIASMQQAVGRFTFFALAPTIYNIGIIIGLTVFTNGISIFGYEVFEGGIMGVALGVVLGSIMQLLVSSIGLIGLGFDYRFKIFWKNQGFKTVLRLLPARSFDQGMDYFNSIVETNLASRMAAGSVRAYQQGTMLHMMPISLIGVAISTAAFPELTERLSQGRADLFKKELRAVIRTIIWLILPIAVVAFFARGFVVNFIVNGGDPTISGILGVLCVAIVFRSIYHIAARSFYAQKDTKTPLYVSFAAIGLNISLAVYFTLQLGMGVIGLALAASIVAAVEVIILFTIMSRRLPGLFNADFINAMWKMVMAAGVTGVIAYVSVQFFQLTSQDQSFFATFPKFTVITIISGAGYVGMSKLLHIKEVDPVLRKAKQLLFIQTKRVG